VQTYTYTGKYSEIENQTMKSISMVVILHLFPWHPTAEKLHQKLPITMPRISPLAHQKLWQIKLPPIYQTKATYGMSSPLLCLAFCFLYHFGCQYSQGKAISHCRQLNLPQHFASGITRKKTNPFRKKKIERVLEEPR